MQRLFRIQHYVALSDGLQTQRFQHQDRNQPHAARLPGDRLTPHKPWSVWPSCAWSLWPNSTRSVWPNWPAVTSAELRVVN